MSARNDDIVYDLAYIDALELEVRSRITYWYASGDHRIPDHVAWTFKQRLYLLNRLLQDLQLECDEKINLIREFESEPAWLEDQVIDRALSKLRGK